MESWYRCYSFNFPAHLLLMLVLVITIGGNSTYGSERESKRTLQRSSETLTNRQSVSQDRPFYSYRNYRHTDTHKLHRIPSGRGLHFAKALTTEEIWYLMQRFAFGDWQDAERVILFLDDLGRVVEDMLQLYTGNEWVNDDRFLFEYEGDSQNPSVIIWQEGNEATSDWENLERDFIEYDEQGREVVIILEDWDGEDWEPWDRVEISYTNDDRYLEQLWYFWWGDEWDLDYRISWVYENGLLIERVDELWDGEDWWPEFRTVYEYDIDRECLRSGPCNLIVELMQYFDEDEEEWVNSFQTLYDYDDDGNEIESISQYWDEDDDEWFNLTRTLSAYDDRNNISEEIHQAWDGSDWIFSQRHSYEYDENDEMLVWLMETWENDQWRSVERFLFRGFDPTGIAGDDTGMPLRFELMQNYPNPFNPATTIRFSIPDQSNVTLEVFDVLGRKVALLLNEELSAGTYSHVFDANHLASGVYLYQLRARDQVETKRLLLLK